MYSICELHNGNKILGHYPLTKNSTINFVGKNNILYCEKNVNLEDSNIYFGGDNSIIYLSSNNHKYKLSISIFNNSVCFIGSNTYINKNLSIILSEEKHCFIGNNCMFSLNIFMRNSDAHLIYNCSNGQRINPTKSIYIGDHVWIGQDCKILKGTQIDSGCIIGAGSVVSGKSIPYNSIWAGNPCTQINNNVFWDGDCVHGWTTERTNDSLLYSDYLKKYEANSHDDYWIYKYTPKECIDWTTLDEFFSQDISCQKKCEFLTNINTTPNKNRFVHKY